MAFATKGKAYKNKYYSNMYVKDEDLTFKLIFDTGASYTILYLENLISAKIDENDLKRFFESKKVGQINFSGAGRDSFIGFLCYFDNVELGFRNKKISFNEADKESIHFKRFYFYIVTKIRKDIQQKQAVVPVNLLGMDVIDHCKIFERDALEDIQYTKGKGFEATYSLIYHYDNVGLAYKFSVEGFLKDFREWKNTGS